MKIVEMLKTNLLIRGLYARLSLCRTYFIIRKKFAQCEKGVLIAFPFRYVNAKNIYLGSNVKIGPHAMISAPNAKFICRGNSAIAEGLTVHTGNHARVVGKSITDIKDDNKPLGYDRDVVVEQDVWIGSNVTLLSGVTIGRGCTIAAGAVVAKSIPAYSVCGGVPAKFIKFYWTVEQIMEHEAKVYPAEERYTRNQLEELFLKYSNNM